MNQHKFRPQGIALPVLRHLDIRRNQQCPCGSGKKAKRCCLPRLQAMATLPPAVATQAVVANILGHWPSAETLPSVPVPSAPETTAMPGDTTVLTTEYPDAASCTSINTLST